MTEGARVVARHVLDGIKLSVYAEGASPVAWPDISISLSYDTARILSSQLNKYIQEKEDEQ